MMQMVVKAGVYIGVELALRSYIVYLALLGPDSEKEERGYRQMAFSSEEQGFRLILTHPRLIQDFTVNLVVEVPTL